MPVFSLVEVDTYFTNVLCNYEQVHYAHDEDIVNKAYLFRMSAIPWRHNKLVFRYYVIDSCSFFFKSLRK